MSKVIFNILKFAALIKMVPDSFAMKVLVQVPPD